MVKIILQCLCFVIFSFGGTKNASLLNSFHPLPVVAAWRDVWPESSVFFPHVRKDISLVKREGEENEVL